MRRPSDSRTRETTTRAPWLVEPTWTVISKNQALKTFKSLFEDFYKDRTGNTVVLAISMEDKRPDFTLVSLGHRLYIVEIKRPKYAFADSDAERLVNYIEVFERRAAGDLRAVRRVRLDWVGTQVIRRMG